MKLDDDSPHESGNGLLVGVLVIVLAGSALGVGFNSMLLSSGPHRGLAWVRTERAIASLEDLVASADSLARATAGVVADSAASAVTAPDAASSPGPAAARPAAVSPARAVEPKAPAPAPATTPTVGSPPGSPPAAAPSTSAPVTAAVAAPFIPDMREPLEAKYETVKALWDANAAVFVDARTAAEFAAEHITRAVSLPLDDLPKRPDLVKNFSSGGRPIVVYCGGGECELSKNLAWNLVEAGQKKVLVYLGGTAEWKQRGGPLASGEAGGDR